jgi:molybdopterin-guanine dinucleotide biosynthesis protein
MRIAVSGTHRVGKTTLVEALADVLPKHEVIAEPYELLEEEGYESATPPTLEDFEAQLECSLEAISDEGADVLFDRCPADLVAYLQSHEDAASFELEEWIDRVKEAMQSLDLVVFVPLEGRAADALAADVDEALRTLLVDDTLGFGVEVLEVRGDLDARLRQVRTRLGR